MTQTNALLAEKTPRLDLGNSESDAELWSLQDAPTSQSENRTDFDVASDIIKAEPAPSPP